MSMQKNIAQLFSDCLPAESILATKETLRPYECDALTAYKTLPMAVLLPDSQQQVVDIVKRCHKENIPIFQFGVRAQSDEEIKLRDEFNIYYKNIEDYRKNPNIRLPKNFPKNIYITFDADCLDPSIMPATGTPVPNGLYYNETFLILEKLIEDKKIIGIDYVEYAPIENFHAYDYVSANIIYDLMKLCLK